MPKRKATSDAMDRKPVTARDVADKLGIAVSTVGRALSDDSRISEKTKHAVRIAAAELGYVGNLPARMMRGNSSHLIGLLLPDVQNDLYATIAQGLTASCNRHGYGIILSITEDDPDVEARHIRDFVSVQASGIIVVPSAAPRRESITLLQKIPHVQLLRRHPQLNDLWFGIDDAAALNKATRHLLDLGHRKIAYLGAPDHLSTGADRLHGVQNAYRDYDLALNDLTVLLGLPTTAWAQHTMQQILTANDRPTAVLAGSAYVTMGIIAAIREAGLRIPDDFSVVGFGDPPWCEWWSPSITVLRPPFQSLARSCALWFIDRLNAKDLPESYNATSSSELVLRASTTQLG